MPNHKASHGFVFLNALHDGLNKKKDDESELFSVGNKKTVRRLATDLIIRLHVDNSQEAEAIDFLINSTEENIEDINDNRQQASLAEQLQIAISALVKKPNLPTKLQITVAKSLRKEIS